MLLKDYLPSRGLEEYIKCYRIVHFNFDKNETPPSKPYTPRPENCLAFYPLDTERIEYADSNKTVKDLPIALIGQHLGVTQRFIGHEFLVVQVIFQAGALYRLTGMPLFELTNEYIAADNVFSKDIQFVNERLHHAQNYEEMVRIVNRFATDLVKKVVKDHQPIDTVCQLLLKQEAALSIDKLARASCLSLKQFERKFKERTGVNPKVFSRLIRFDNAFRTRNAQPQTDWLTIAFDCHYYDYQHLVRDYKDFTGMSPNAFHALDSPEAIFGMSEQFYQTETVLFHDLTTNKSI